MPYGCLGNTVPSLLRPLFFGMPGKTSIHFPGPLVTILYLIIILSDEAENHLKNYGDRGGCYNRH